MKRKRSRTRPYGPSVPGDPFIPHCRCPGGTLNGQTIIITGANRGIGRAMAEALAGQGNTIIMACRNAAQARDAASAIAAAIIDPMTANSGTGRGCVIEVMELDLASFDSIRKFAGEIENRKIRPHVLVNNAGVLCRTYGETVDGFERTLQVNYLGPFLLTSLLLPFIRDNGGQIINMSSLIFRMGRADDRLFGMNGNNYDRFKAYADSKLALLLFSFELAERLAGRGIRVNSVDPGIVDTNIITMHGPIDPLVDFLFRPFIRNPEQGAATCVYLARNDMADQPNGQFFRNKRIRRLSDRYVRHPLRKELLRKTGELLGISL